MTNQLVFNNTNLTVVNHNSQIWLSSVELAKALQYSDSRSVSKIFNQYSDEFSLCMTRVIESVTSGNYRKKVRYFSLRGVHLIAMFARTQVAKDFRRWVLDILDKETQQVEIISIQQNKPARRYLVEIKITDNLFKGSISVNAVCDDFNAMITGFANTLGYKINSMSQSDEGLRRLL